MDNLLVLVIRTRLCTKLYAPTGLDLPHCRHTKTRQLQGRLPVIPLLQDLIFSVCVLRKEYREEGSDTAAGFQALQGFS